MSKPACADASNGGTGKDKALKSAKKHALRAEGFSFFPFQFQREKPRERGKGKGWE